MIDGLDTSQASSAKGRNSLVTQGALVLALIVALLAVLLISENTGESLESLPPALASAPAPRIGVAVAASKSSLSEAVKEEITNAPDMAQTALDNSASSLASAPRPPVVPEETSDASLRISERASASSASPVVVLSPAKGAQVQASSSRSSSSVMATGQTGDMTGFTLQLGVFSNIKNAEALQRKLKQAGINSQIETRVQLGPFRTKEEATHAQEKLRRLGLATGMMVPLQKRHE